MQIVVGAYIEALFMFEINQSGEDLAMFMYLDEKEGYFRLGKEGEREGREYFYSKNCGLIQDKSDRRNMRNLSLSMADS